MIRQIAKHLGVFLLWNLAIGAALLLLPTVYGLTATLLLSAWLLQGYLLPGGGRSTARRIATLRLRPLRGATLGWTLAAVPVLLLLSWAMSEVYTGLVPVPPAAFNPFDPILAQPGGRLAIAVLAIGIAPVVEEFFFRGLIQHPLERRWGAAAGITVAATLFAAVHLLPWVFPLHLLLGVLLGTAVYLSRSIWTGVLLHAANNVAAFLGLDAASAATRPTVWDAGPTAEWWGALVILILALGAAGTVGRGLRCAAAKERSCALTERRPF